VYKPWNDDSTTREMRISGIKWPEPESLYYTGQCLVAPSPLDFLLQISYDFLLLTKKHSSPLFSPPITYSTTQVDISSSFHYFNPLIAFVSLNGTRFYTCFYCMDAPLLSYLFQIYFYLRTQRLSNSPIFYCNLYLSLITY
jgi:hypothetical protein